MFKDNNDEYYVKSIGTPEIYKNGTKIKFPFLKSKMLAFLIIEEKNLSRENAASLLWSEKDLETGKRNLNNALCCIKHLIPFLDLNKDTIDLPIDREYLLSRDTDKLSCIMSIDKDDMVGLFEPYMNLPEIENIPIFDEWLRTHREKYHRLLVENVRKRAQNMLRQDAPSSVEDAIICYELLVKIEPYDEILHSELICAYINADRKIEAAMAAKSFSKRIKDDFEIEEPVDKILSLALVDRKICQATALRLPAKDNPLSRNIELLKILVFLSDAADTGSTLPSSVFIWGEEGIGKNTLISDVTAKLKTNGWSCHSIRCYQEEKNRPLAPFIQFLHDQSSENFLIEQKQPYITAENIPVIVEILLNHFSANSNIKNVLIVENLQWMDSSSWMILEAVLWRSSSPRYLIVSGYGEAKSLFMRRAGFIDESFRKLEIRLERFNRDETAVICKELQPDINWTKNQIDEIYSKTDGNPFFITEYLKFNSSGDKLNAESLQSRFLYRTEIFSDTEKLFINAIAVAGEGASMTQIAQILCLDYLVIAECFQNIKFQGLIREHTNDDGEVFYSFTHPRIREDLLSEMSGTLQRALHLKCLDFILKNINESFLSWQEYSLLICHSERAGLFEQELKWRVRELKFHFQYTHVISPVLSDQEISRYIPSTEDVRYTRKALNEALTLLNKLIRRNGRTDELVSCEIYLMVIEAGYNCWEGKFTNSEAILKEALLKAIKNKNNKEIIAVCEQFCYLTLQIGKYDIMKKYAQELYRSAIREHDHVWMGTGIRFIATSLAMQGKFKAADKLLNISVRLFEKIEESGANYTISLIAAEHVKGTIQILTGNFAEALAHFKNCIYMGESLILHRGQGLFLAEAGYCLFRLGKTQEAEEILERTERLYDLIGAGQKDFRTMYGTEIIYALLGYLKIKQADWENGNLYWNIALNLSNKTKHPLGKNILSWATASIIDDGCAIPEDCYNKYFSKTTA